MSRFTEITPAISLRGRDTNDTNTGRRKKRRKKRRRTRTRNRTRT